MDKTRINAAINSLETLNRKEWDKVKLVIDHYFRIEAKEIADKITLIDDEKKKKIKNEFSL